jgi:hypothetical protein
MSDFFARLRDGRRTRRQVSAIKRRQLLLQSLEGRRLLAADALDDSPKDELGGSAAPLISVANSHAPAPIEITIADSGNPNRIRLVMEDSSLQVWDDLAGSVLATYSTAEASEIIVTGSSDPDDLVLDFAGGEFGIPLQYDGAQPTELPGDQLTLINGASETITHHFLDASSGEIVLEADGIGQIGQAIGYTGLEPVIDNLDAVNRVFTFVGGTETIRLSDDLDPTNGLNRIDSTLGELVDFAGPSGAGSSLTINAGSGMDLIEIDALESPDFFELYVNGGDGSDQIELYALDANLSAYLNGDAGNDTFRIGSTADQLDSIAGSVFVDGGANLATPVTSETVTAKGNSVSATVETGDQLLVRDGGNAAAGLYEIDIAAVHRVDLNPITYSAVESINLETGVDADIVNIASTPDLASLQVFTGPGSDVVDISDSGDDSLVRVDTAEGDDQVDVDMTGDRSVTIVNTGGGNDDVNIATTGSESGLNVDTGDGSDVLVVENTGERSVSDLRLGNDSDIANLRGTGADSYTDVYTGSGNDTVNVSSDASGDRANPSGDPAGDLDSLLGELCVYGEDNDLVPTVSETVVASGYSAEAKSETISSPGASVTATVPIGDTLNLSDEASTTGNSYTIDASQFEKNGQPPLIFAGIESLNVESGSGADQVTVVTTTADRFTSVSTHGGEDTVSILDTGDDSILVVDTGMEGDAVSVSSTGVRSVSTIATAAGADEIDVTLTGDESGVALDAGDDSDEALISGTGTASVLVASMGTSADFVQIDQTGSASHADVATGAGDDTVNVIMTGNSSSLGVDTGGGQDAVEVSTTGERSMTYIAAGTGEDDLIVNATGSRSGLGVDAGADADVLTIFDTGVGVNVPPIDPAVNEIRMGAGNDIVNLRRTGSDSLTDVFGGDGIDTVNISSDANGTRGNPRGTLAGDLDGLLGEICVFGEDSPVPDTVSGSVTGRQTDGDTVTVDVEVELGDELNIVDAASSDDNVYALTATTFQRTDVSETGRVTYETVERLNVETGTGNDTVGIGSTADRTYLDLTTGDGNDAVSLADTGEASLVEINTQAGSDSVLIESTGLESVLAVRSEDGEDSIRTESIGELAGISLETGGDDDTITLDRENPPNLRSERSVLRASVGMGEDRFEVYEVYLNTVVDLNGDDDNDTFSLAADDSASTGYLGRLNDDPINVPSEDATAATRQLYLDGGSNGAATTSVFQGASLTGGPTLDDLDEQEESEPAVEIGDRVMVDASSATAELDLRYVITGFSEGVLATTMPGDPRATVGNEVFETLSIESVDVIGGADDDVMTVSSDVPIELSQTGQRLAFNGSGGANRFEVLGTDAADQITVGPLASPEDVFEAGNVDFIRVEAGDGDDQLVNRTAISSVIDGMGGSDIMLGGSGRDLLTSGDGVDYIFGRGGDDVLFVDQDLGNDTPSVLANEIIDGGTDVREPYGDVCVQYDVDSVRKCEVLGDGGGRKDVFTWLSGIFFNPEDITFDPPSPVLTPFLSASASPAGLVAVTEPSRLPVVPSATPAAIPSGSAPATASTTSFDVLDTNQNGSVTPADALLVINQLGVQSNLGSGEFNLVVTDLARRADVNRNGMVEPRDALMIINAIARQSAVTAAEGESIERSETAKSWSGSVDQVFGGDDEEETWTRELEASKLF